MIEKKNKCDPAVDASKLKSSRGPDGNCFLPLTGSVRSSEWRLIHTPRSTPSGKLTVNTKTILEKEDIIDTLVERERESMRGKVFQDVDL